MRSDFVEMAQRVRALMRNSSQQFNELALDLYSLQRQSNTAYARICEQRGVANVKNWQDIPAVPTLAFKETEMTSLPPEERTNVFFSSGTTQKDRSRHFHSRESLALYEESLLTWFVNFFESERWLFLTPGAHDAPNSSLAHMFGTIAARQNSAEVEFAGNLGGEGEWNLDLEKVSRFFDPARRAYKPVAILGTAFLFVHLLDALEKKTVRLPENSWAMETGGYKGRSRAIPKEELHEMISARLGILPANIFGEYGMSELSSQAYASSDGLFRFPPWARVRMISPATGREAREGEPGLIRVYDLANVWSVMAVQTEDIGIKEGNGFRLVGRAAQAQARGCSLMTV